MDHLESFPSERELPGKLDYAFQPILNIHTGTCMGVEALLRGTEAAGFFSIKGFFDDAYARGRLYPVEMALRAKALRKFCEWPHPSGCKLFFNVDNRLFKLTPDHAKNTQALLESFRIHPSDFCIEISELTEIGADEETKNALDDYRDRKIKIAVDDFGAGFSCFQMLYHSEPDFIKIDRFFIVDIFKDPRKKLFVSKLINLAHILGILVIAEGVETKDDFYVCREVGCDYFQGFLAQRPTFDWAKLLPVYQEIAVLAKEDRRKPVQDQDFIRRQIEHIEPIFTSAESVVETLKIFKKNETATFFPVLNEDRVPLGIIREKELKKYTYSMYGWQILAKMGIKTIIKDFVAKCVIAEITTPIDMVTEIFMSEGQFPSEGIIITENGKYIGFLNALSLLKVLNEKNLSLARDQNPLTGLPGNKVVHDHISQAATDDREESLIVYFDFNYFKSFNDKYGFRLGDRAILLFADILRKNIAQDRLAFFGHVGGDDFVCIFKVDDERLPGILNLIRCVQDKFREDVRLLYSDEDRKAGFVSAIGRSGEIQRFELMSVSAAVLHIRSCGHSLTPEAVSDRIACLKQDAKNSASYFHYVTI